MLEGCTIREIKTKHVDDPLGMHGSHFIDQHSGDLYQFDIDMDPKGVWSPFMNVGMTLRRAMGKKNKEILRPDPVNGMPVCVAISCDLHSFSVYSRSSRLVQSQHRDAHSSIF
jgi:hypothetical protein